MGALMRAHDWRQSPLGHPDAWPEALKLSVSICLNSRFPMVLWWGPEFVMLYNDAWRPVLGATKHPGGLGRPGVESWPEIWEIIGEQMRQVLYEGQASWSEDLLLVLDRNGYAEEAYFTYSYSPIMHADGKIGGVFSAVNETTERVLGERRLRVLRDLAEQTADAKTMADACSNFARVLGDGHPDLPFAALYVLDDVHTQAVRLAVSGIAAADERLPLQVCLEDEDVWRIAATLRHGGSHVVEKLVESLGPFPGGVWKESPQSAVVLPIARAGREGERTGVLVAGVNPRRPLDAGYRDFLNLVASHMATAITNARAYEEERRKAKALAELDRAKTVFFSNVSHEFRTPLTLMLAPLQDVLADATAGPRIAEQIQIAHRNGLRLLRLVNSLLDFSRIEAGRMRAAFRPTNLASLTEDIASSFRSAMERAGLEFEVRAEPLPTPVYLDAEMWEKVVLNLLSNAFKFTLHGRVSVVVSPARNRAGACVAVSDTGSGIPEAELPRLFERFHRVDGAQGRSFEGTGIGLALVQELVALHGGEIAVESVVGQGTTFKVFLPYGSSHLPANQVVEEVELVGRVSKAGEYVEEALRWLPGQTEDAVAGLPTDRSRHPKLTGSRVLVADDNADMRSYVERLLKEQGVLIEAVPDGEAALAAVKRQPCDLVLSDVMMPKLDGFGLLTALRSAPETSGVPVILLSARAGEEARVEGLKAGADDYLVKPFSARELVAKVASQVELSRLRREAGIEIQKRQIALEDETRALRAINRAAEALSSDLDVERIVQTVVDVGVEISGAAFGAFFYRKVDEQGERYTLYVLSGAPRSAFERFPMPRNTPVFGPTFRGEGIVRSDDILADPRYGQMDPHRGMPKGHLPVRSYLAAPVISRTGEVLGGLFFGHPDVGVFNAQAEERLAGLAAQAAVAMDNARLFEDAQNELGQRRRAEQQLQALNRELEQRVQEEVASRTAAEAALRQAQKMEAIGHLTGGVAHDFNNLLTVIMGGLDTIRRSGPGEAPRIQRAADMAWKGAERAAGLTSRLLSFARRQALEPKPVDLNTLVRDMTDLLHRTLGENIELEGVLTPRLWTVEIDHNQLESAILNLAVNARDAMPDGGKLTIETANSFLDESYAATDAEVKPGQYVMLSVSDTGSGMDKATLAKAFEPFFTTKDVGRGTGLGLSMVYGFAKQSNGHVTIYSEPGEGTTVKLYFPRSGGLSMHDPRASAAGVPTNSAGEVVLVVEDNEDVRNYSVLTLAELGYEVLEANDGESAMAIIASDQRIDLLFTDVVLPGQSGRAIAEQALARRPALKVLYTTGYSRNAIVHHGRLDAGVNLLSKPFTFEQLAARVRDVLDAP